MTQFTEPKHGFKCLSNTYIDEVGSRCYLLEHEKSGAKLMYLENDDDNKVFSATFKTPPSDHTGVPHIVEHCVLSGSRKYHTKEPFMDMVKGSMNTFINAMTFSDKTMYPVASKNDKDFMNLMDVYLDAVFFPKIYEIEEIFMQEGWRYDIQNPEDPITYKGVVYNEMKGAYSDPERELDHLMEQTLLKGTPYANESGGHPNHITALTYEDFLAFHKTHYHPSNGYLYLYGNLDIDAALKHIDGEYLSQFDKKVCTLEMDTLPKDNPKSANGYYPIGDDDATEGKAYSALSYIIGKATDPAIHLTATVLLEALVNSSASPLKKALLEADIAQDISGSTGGGLYKRFEIKLKHCLPESLETFKNIVVKTLKQVSDEGIDPALLSSAINKLTYALKEADGFHTKGIIYHMYSMDSWLYTDDATALLRYNEALQTMQDGIESGYFENFVREVLLTQEPTICMIEPRKGLLKEKTMADEAALKAYKDALTPEALEQLVAKNRALKEKQLSPDTKAALNTIPKLSRTDIAADGERIEATTVKTEPYTLLYTDSFTGGIQYVDVAFDIGHLTNEELPYVSLTASLLGKLSTETYDYAALSNAIYQHTGGISFNLLPFKHHTDQALNSVKLICRTKTTPDQLESAFNLIRDIVLKTQFGDKKRLKEELSALKASLQSDLIDYGNRYASGRVAAYLGGTGAIADATDGIGFYQFIASLLAQYDEKYSALIGQLDNIYAKLFKQNDAIVSYTGEASELPTVERCADAFVKHFGTATEAAVDFTCALGLLNEGLKTASSVQYVAQGFDRTAYGHGHTGAQHVLVTWLNGDFLHNRVRAKGGAYGCYAQVSPTGYFGIASYRDPNLQETYAVYDEIAEALATTEFSDEDVQKLIVGTMSKIDGARTPRQKGYLGLTRFITGETYDAAQRIRKEIIETTPADLKNCAELMADFSKANARCTLGNSDKISESENCFKTCVTLDS